LPARHFGPEQALQDEFHHFGGGIEQPLAIKQGIRVEALQPDIKEIQRHWIRV
jgi:hypothetical protein